MDEGKGMVGADGYMGIDRLRPRSASARVGDGSARLHPELSCGLCIRTQTDSNTTLRLLGQSRHSDDRVEKCLGHRWFGIGRVVWGLRAGIPQNPP